MREEAAVYDAMVDPAMPDGGIHSGDERHLGGCFQDNRVFPCEGIQVGSMAPEARTVLDDVVEDFIAYQPDGPRRARRREIQEHYGETWFSWIGGWAEPEAIYFRPQSPVLVPVLDHHAGFLSNDEPAPFQMHAVVRTPARGGPDPQRQRLRRELVHQFQSVAP